MSLTPQQDERNCFVACSQEEISNGGCACFNRAANITPSDSTIFMMKMIMNGYKPVLLKYRRGTKIEWVK